VHFIGGQDSRAGDFPGVQDLATQRHDGLEFLVAGLLCRAASGIALHQKKFGAREVLRNAIGELARQGRPLGDFLADHLLFGFQSCGGTFDGQHGDGGAGFHVLVQPKREGVMHG
jgi:hypothetical protein